MRLIASWLPGREILVTGDSAYGGASVLRKLPDNMDLISHVHPGGALYKPAPKTKKGEKGHGAYGGIAVGKLNDYRLQPIVI